MTANYASVTSRDNRCRSLLANTCWVAGNWITVHGWATL